MQRLISVAILSVTALCVVGSAMAQQTPAAPGSGVPHGTRSSEIMQVKITVSDMDRSLKYYQDGIGLIRASTHRTLPPGTPMPPARPGFSETPLNFTGSLAEAYFTLMQEAGHVPTPESAYMTVIGIKVKSVRDTLARLKAHGYPVVLLSQKIAESFCRCCWYQWSFIPADGGWDEVAWTWRQ